MDQTTRVELLQELVELNEAKSPYLDEAWIEAPLDRYVDEGIFQREQQCIFQRLPMIAAHASELPQAGSFLTRDLAGRPLLLLRDEAGTAHAYYNVCRHRGARLVGEEAGCKHRFSCPYHAWTYDSGGRLIGVPHEETGFPGLKREAHGLKAVACEERAGWIWISFGEAIDVAAHLGELDGEFGRLGADAHEVHDSSTRELACNWKILVEGGIEAYHFRVAHRKTIAPLFLDNLSSYRSFGLHLRSILPRSTLASMAEQPQDHWDLRAHANVLYSLFPANQFLVQEDHFVWIQSTPLSPGRTRLRLSTMVPTETRTAESESYWDKHHELTLRTLEEDFALGEGIQRGLSSGANAHLNFGRFEGALAAFNASVDEALQG